MEIEDVRTFLVLAELSSFKATGERLGRTQAAISLRLQKLEDELGCRLIDRSGRVFSLTEEGKEFSADATALVRAHDALRDRFQGATEECLRIAVTPDLASGPLKLILKSFSLRHPNVRLDLTVDITRGIMERLSKGSMDIGIARVDGSAQPLRILHEEPIIWIGSSELVGAPPEQVPIIVLADSYPSSLMLSELARRNLDHRIVARCENLAGVRAAIEAGLGVTALLKSALPLLNSELREAPIEWNLPALPDAQTAVFSAKTHLGKVERSFISFTTSALS